MTKDVLSVFWKYAKQHWVTACISGLFFVIASLIGDVITPIFLKRFIDAIQLHAPIEATLHALWVLAAFSTVTWASWRTGGMATMWFETQAMKEVQIDAFHYLLGHSHSFFSDNFTGSLTKRINRLAGSFETIADNILFNFIPLIVSVSAMLVVIFLKNRTIGLIFTGWIVVFALFNSIFAKWKRPLEIVRALKDTELGGLAADVISNSATVRFFSRIAHEMDLYKVKAEEARLSTWRSWLWGEGNFMFHGLVGLVVQIAMLYVAVQAAYAGRMTIGDVVLLQSYFLVIAPKFREADRIFRRTYAALTDAKEMVDILQLPHEIRDVRGAKPLVVKKGEIQFEHVTFRYQKEREAMKDFDLRIRGGERVGLVGASGAGKSTLIKLLLRLHDIQKGKILVDGQSIAKVTQESLREQIAFVPQEPILFHRTLMENIRYGRLDATDEEVMQAAQHAHCHEFIARLPSGYNTYVGERGVKLSGGERQRVAIARAILKNAPILVLDEATSSLDSESEQLIQSSLQTLMKGKTVIAVAHRLSTIMAMDRILVLEDGAIIDQGSHAQLLAGEGVYQKLWNIQASGFSS